MADLSPSRLQSELMKHGEIKIRVQLRGEPQKIITYWRGWLPDAVPERAAITIVRKSQKPRNRWWLSNDPNFYFESMTRTEKKRAELSISDKSLHMTATEIATARELTDTTYEWLSGRRGIPTLSEPIDSARLEVTVQEGPELIDAIEKFGDPEVVSAVGIGPVYLQGDPRRPNVRWLPNLTGADKSVVLGELKYFEIALADGQAGEVRTLVERAAGVFKKASNAKKSKLNKRISEIFGYGTGLMYEGHAITDAMIEGYEYDDIMSWLEEEEKKPAPCHRIRSWRGGS